MMKYLIQKNINNKINLIQMSRKILMLLTAVCITLSFAGHSFKQQTTMVNDRVIKRTLSGGHYILYEKGEVIVKFKESYNLSSGNKFNIGSLDNSLVQASVEKISSRFPATEVTSRMMGISEMQKIYTVKFSGNEDPYELAEAIFNSNREILDYACADLVMEADYTPNDPGIAAQYHIGRINSYGAWDITKGDTTVLIGIIDSGSDLDHPDLAANIKYNYADIPGNNIDDDANGHIDDYLGFDFGDGDPDPNCNNNHSATQTNCAHGSHVSGCASQVTDNGTNGGGIGFKCKLIISKHGQDNDFSAPGGQSFIYNSDQGFYYCVARGAKVINCSFGSGGPSGAQNNAVQFAWNNGAVICASAGNDNSNVLRYPGAYQNVVCVAASNTTDLKASFSNFHDTVDVTAPGDVVSSTYWNNNYALLSGTSMSSPVTAGTVGLIRSRYPAWTTTQVVERLKLGVDSIYNVNPGFIGQLGTGRINAFKCVSDLPIVGIVSTSPSDSILGNNDKVFEVDEVVTIGMTYKNTWLAGNNVSLRLSTTDPNVEIVQDSVFAGNLSPYTTYSVTQSASFRVKAKPGCPFDKAVTFTLSTSNNAYADGNTKTFTVTFRKGWATHSANNMKLSLTRDGAIGKKTQNYGSSLNITGYTGAHIFEGGLMIGVNNTKVSDVSRRGNSPANVSDTDFTALNAYTLQNPGTVSNEDGKGYFNDDGAGGNKIGVTVRSESYAWNSAPDANYIILRYTIKNSSGANITNMFAGMYMYYTPNGANSNNTAALDTAGKTGYSFNSTTTNPYLGVSLLSGQTLNFKAINATDILSGFTTQEKWDAMSAGIVNGSMGPGINCFVISAGPINLNNNDSVVVGFAVVKGNDLNDLKTNSATAKNRFGLIGVEQISSVIPDKFALYQNYPNPFNPSTTIKFDVAKTGLVKIKIFDIIGREVSQFIQMLSPGEYKYEFNNSGLASGVYFYKLETDQFVDTKKMIMLK
jgi:serine protease